MNISIYIKILGAALVVIASGMSGFAKCFRYNQRIKCLKDFRESFIMLSGQIRFARVSIPEALKNISYSSEDTCIQKFYSYISEALYGKNDAQFKDIWNRAVKEYISDTVLNKKDCEIIGRVSGLPLFMDGTMQINMLNEVAEELSHTISEAQRELSCKFRIWKCTGIAAGAVIVLVLI